MTVMCPDRTAENRGRVGNRLPTTLGALRRALACDEGEPAQRVIPQGKSCAAPRAFGRWRQVARFRAAEDPIVGNVCTWSAISTLNAHAERNPVVDWRWPGANGSFTVLTLGAGQPAFGGDSGT